MPVFKTIICILIVVQLACLGFNYSHGNSVLILGNLALLITTGLVLLAVVEREQQGH